MLNKILKSSLIAIPIIISMSQSAWATCSGSDIIYVDVGASGGTYDGI